MPLKKKVLGNGFLLAIDCTVSRFRLFLMVSGKFSPGNFSGTKWAREVSGGNLLHPDTFSDFPEPHPAVPCSRKFSQISGSNSQRLGIKKGGTCRATRNDWKPQSSQVDSNHSVRFKSVRSGTKNNSLGKATFSTPMSLYSLYSRAYVVK